MNSITAKITSSLDVIIKSEQESEGLNQELIAVNWFDTRVEWLYHLYNKLASRSVFKVGGSPLFKSKVVEDLSDEEGKRMILLIVKYPHGMAFKKLLQSTYFKLVSLLRIKAVKKFTFSFTKAIVKPNFSEIKSHYLVHHFNDRTDLKELLDFIDRESKDLTVNYAGYSFAYLNRKEKGKELKQISSIIDNILIISSNNKENLKIFKKSKLEKKLHGYSGLMERIF